MLSGSLLDDDEVLGISSGGLSGQHLALFLRHAHCISGRPGGGGGPTLNNSNKVFPANAAASNDTGPPTPGAGGYPGGQPGQPGPLLEHFELDVQDQWTVPVEMHAL